MSDEELSDEDKALFRQMMAKVKPLAKTKTLPLSQRSVAMKSPSGPLPPHEPQTDYFLSNHYHEAVSAESILTYCKESIPGKRFKQLKRGEIPLDARLDLHGFNPDRARELLCQWIEQNTQAEHRCLLIIHGKGSLHGEPPVLKNLVNHWLQQLPQVLAFHSALPRHGGSGALYVLLKRERFIR